MADSYPNIPAQHPASSIAISGAHYQIGKGFVTSQKDQNHRVSANIVNTSSKKRNLIHFGHFNDITDAEATLKLFEQLRAQKHEVEEIKRLISNEFAHKQNFMGKNRDTRLLQNSEEIDWLVQCIFLG